MAQHYVRPLHPGMGQAVAERTILRKDAHGKFETWGDVAHRVALGNSMLHPTGDADYEPLKRWLSCGGTLMSGRHLQHGDATQPDRNLEVFSNCATAAASFLEFLLLLNGSGVGRCYDDDMLLVNWDNSPTVWCVLDEDHPDFNHSQHLSARQARHQFALAADCMWFEVPDTREGWGKGLELVEMAAFEKVHKDKLLILDFSKVRPAGSIIKGMQDRPSSGPVPLMNAFAKAMMVRGAGLPRWKQTLYVDHFFAECVLVGGARRAAKWCGMYWKNRNVLDFIRVKRPVEYDGKDMEEVLAYREAGNNPQAFLWSGNMSVMVDAEFWAEKDRPGTWASKVWTTATECAYGDGTGEPGFVNVDQLEEDREGWGDLHRGDFVGSKRYSLEDGTQIYMSKLAKRAQKRPYCMIVNPCGEVALNVLGGYCIIADGVPYHCAPLWGQERGGQAKKTRARQYHAEWDANVEDMLRVTTRALIRVNLMDSMYGPEVRRTNRIGVGLTGLHEYMWTRWGLSFRDALAPSPEAEAFWNYMSKLSWVVVDEAERYSKQLGVATPHTSLTMKPAGTTSKLFGLTEGAHLAAMIAYLRWVQFRNDDPLVTDYQARGYPMKILEQYRGHTVIGFPTQPVITTLMPPDKLVTAAEATPKEQYRWLMLLEATWIKGGKNQHGRGNQVSYTLKYNPEVIKFTEFNNTLNMYQRVVRCCTVMPQEDVTAYEYQPEQPVTKAEFEAMAVAIDRAKTEDVGLEHLGCNGGACPVSFNEDKGVIHEPGYA